MSWQELVFSNKWSREERLGEQESLGVNISHWKGDVGITDRDAASEKPWRRSKNRDLHGPVMESTGQCRHLRGMQSGQ